MRRSIPPPNDYQCIQRMLKLGATLKGRAILLRKGVKRMNRLDLQLNPVRYAHQSEFEELTSQKLEELLSGFKESFRTILRKIVEDYDYLGGFGFVIEEGMPVKVDPTVVEALSQDQQDLIGEAHDLCSSEDFWKETKAGQLSLFHFVEHCVMAVYLSVINGILGTRFDASFLAYPIALEDGSIKCAVKILQKDTLDPSVFNDIITLALEYANAVVNGRPMDILPRIKGKIEKYPLRGNS